MASCNDSNKTANETKTTDAVVCNEPYMRFAAGCCLDQNANKICDNDEVKKEETNVKIEPPIENLTKNEITKESIPVSTKKTINEALFALVTIYVNPRRSAYINGQYVDFTYDWQGSGFIVSTDGYILTNYHVAGYASSMVARRYDGIDLPVSLVASDDKFDIAVLKIENLSYRTDYLNFSKDSGKVGDVVYVLGAPLGMEASVSKGIISQKNRRSYLSEDNIYDKYLQTDAAINGGNSGGPVVNEDREIVGMSTYKETGWGVEGLNYALQSEVIQDFYNRTYKGDMFKLLDIANAAKSNQKRDHSSQSYSKGITVDTASGIYLLTDGEKTLFDRMEFTVSNDKFEDVNLCYDLILVPKKGFIDYQGTLKASNVIRPKSITKINIEETIELKSDKLHYYELTLFDCNSKEKYGKVFGAGVIKGQCTTQC